MVKKQPAKAKEAKTYGHSQEHPLRPDIGTEAQFKKKKPPVTYRYDSSLAPSLEWDDHPAREQAESEINAISNYLTELSIQLQKINDIESSLDTDGKQALNELKNLLIKQVNKAQESLDKLQSMSEPFLNWTGKAERLSFDVPTLPLFVHERLSTRAIIETLKSHKSKPLAEQLSFFSDPQWSITDQILRAYEHQGDWVNRMILGDSLVTMNSLLQYEGLGGKVQMIYMDPPYGVKFGSNFQPFVRKRDVKHNDDEDFTREPEMVQAYRDTWELGLHSYLTYLRDRLLLARELLTDSGSIFVQISDENVHHVRELMDEVFGGENFIAQINYQTMTPLESGKIESVFDYILWYAKAKEYMKYYNLYSQKKLQGNSEFKFIETGLGEYRELSSEELQNIDSIDNKNKIFKRSVLESSGYTKSCTFPFSFGNKSFIPRGGKSWRTNEEGMKTLHEKGRLFVLGSKLYYKLFYSDFSYTSLLNTWSDTVAGYSEAKLYVVQTNLKAIQRCLLMTTDPGDLVLDITCGSGTTAYVAEQWGRRWITCDVSRVPLALARQRLLTATFPWYQLKDGNSPAGGFVYKRKQNNKGEEIGGIVPHITLKSIANNEPPDEEILVDRPESDNGIVRVSSPFTIEGTIPPPVEMEDQEAPETETVDIHSTASFTDRMLEVLRKSPKLHLPNNNTVTFTSVRQPIKSQHLSAEAMVDDKPVAFVFGPENGAIAEGILFHAATEARAKQYHHFYVIGFAIAAKARQFVEHCHETMDIPATYIQATPDLLMGDLLKNMRSSQIFSVCGLPEIEISKNKEDKYQVELLGLDIFDPVTMDIDHQQGKNVPAWFLDTDYNGLCFYVRQAFFPRTSAWDSIKKALKGSYEDSVWEHLAGTTSAPFEAGEHKQVAVKVIDDRGNELLVVKSL
ncbi:site-specific DNA-methyltransferase [Cuspidothrix issatschenkoi LEGE 03284]|uniref:site-specific DNA-methyltransferase n=1 Tax=Cuspidothrix issatschenkoi TaxID=230752 RepID=UPI001882EE18|nr:site-specific DNA-methyltransferase [Cuspidothrix issatschenkoi]MBE9234319.1 site-specific DNA-methyltransferase [Cuspidothrix issatschenkoi LEGE 03284]